MTGSVLVLRPKEVKPSRVKVGCYTLLAFVFLQPFMYGQARSAEISRDQPFMYGQARDALSGIRTLVSQPAPERTRIQLYSRGALNTPHNPVSPP